MLRWIFWTPLLTFALACAAKTPGAEPGDMSATEHEREAAEHARATRTEAQQDAEAERQRIACTGQSIPVGMPCWTSALVPTEEHRRAAEMHRRHAAEHRAASIALREAEASACSGITPDDRDISPFEHTEDIASVEPLRERTSHPTEAYLEQPPTSPAKQRTVGALITFHAVPGMTAEWLQRIVDCHLARNAALGHVAPTMPNCPLVPRGVTAEVRSTGRSFAVAVRSDDPPTAREILTRAQRLFSEKEPEVSSR